MRCSAVWCSAVWSAERWCMRYCKSWCIAVRYCSVGCIAMHCISWLKTQCSAVQCILVFRTVGEESCHHLQLLSPEHHELPICFADSNFSLLLVICIIAVVFQAGTVTIWGILSYGGRYWNLIIPSYAHQEFLNYLRMMAQIKNLFNAPFHSVSGEPHTSLLTPIKDECP